MRRREFLRTVSGSAVGMAAASTVVCRARAAAKDAANGKIVVAVVGVHGRGQVLLDAFARHSQVELKYVCDLDPGVLASRVEQISSVIGRTPEAVQDFRRILDDRSVDAVVVATPDHWHALPSIMACQAGKDVYVEKPDGHNLLEGRVMVAAAKKYGRVVQLGTMARSGLDDAIAYLAEGKLGRVIASKAWESAKQTNLGRPADGAPPKGVNYDFWLGPAPSRPFNPMRFHKNWRWFFDYGGGDLANDGVHRLDLAWWGLQTAVAAAKEPPLGFPRAVYAAGGKCYFDDAQEWPDTMMITYDFPGRVMTYEMRIWSAYPQDGEAEGAAIYGDEGYVVLGNRRWRAFGPKGQLVKEVPRTDPTEAHVRNFIDCMHSRAKPAADLETVGHPSSLLCHLGNAAWRAGRSLRFDPDTYTFFGDEAATQFVTRPEYRKPWRLPQIAEL